MSACTLCRCPSVFACTLRSVAVLGPCVFACTLRCCPGPVRLRVHCRCLVFRRCPLLSWACVFVCTLPSLAVACSALLSWAVRLRVHAAVVFSRASSRALRCCLGPCVFVCIVRARVFACAVVFGFYVVRGSCAVASCDVGCSVASCDVGCVVRAMPAMLCGGSAMGAQCGYGGRRWMEMRRCGGLCAIRLAVGLIGAWRGGARTHMYCAGGASPRWHWLLTGVGVVRGLFASAAPSG